MRWHINVYVTIRCYQYIISYCYFTYDGRINSNPYTITNSWYSLARTPVCLPNYNTLMNIAIATYFCTTIDGYIICMPYKNTPQFANLLQFLCLYVWPIDGTKLSKKIYLVARSL